MMIDQSTLYMGIVISGGVLILVFAAFTFFKSAFNKNPAQSARPIPVPSVQKQEKPGKQDKAGKSGGVLGSLKRRKAAPPAVPQSKAETSATAPASQPQNEKGGKTGGLLGRFKGIKPASAPGAQNKTEEASPARSARMPDLASLGVNAKKPRIITGQEPEDSAKVESNDAAPAVAATQVTENMPDKSPADAAQTPAPATEIEASAANDANSVIPAQPDIETEPKQEPETLENHATAPAQPNAGAEPKQELKAPASAPEPENPKPEKSGNLMDMFKEEMAVESESSKFAKNLEEVDIHDLLEESQNLINMFTRRGS